MTSWKRIGLTAQRNMIPLGVIHVGSCRGVPLYVDFPTTTATTWGLLRMKAVRCYLREGSSLLAFQFSADPPREGELGVSGAVKMDDGTRRAVRIWCGRLLKQANASPGYYLSHREGQWLIVTDLATPLNN